MWWKRLTGSAYLVVVFTLVGLILHPQMNVCAAAQLGSAGGTWSKLDRPHCPWKLALGGGRTSRWSCRAAAAVAYVREPETICCAQLWTEELHRRWRYSRFKGHTVFSYRLIWMWMIQISLAKLVKGRKKFSHTWHRGAHMHTHTHTYCSLTLDPGDLVSWMWSSAGCESTFLCGIFLNIVLWPERRKSVL